MSRHGETCGNKCGFPLFSPDSDDRLSLNFHRFVILYRSCDTRSASLGQYCLPKVSNGFIKGSLDTGNCQRLAFTVGVSQHMHKQTNLWKFELNRSSKLRDNNERRKHPFHTKLYAFRWLISRPQVLNLRSRNQIRGKLLPFSKTMALQRELFLTMLYTINLSPLLVTKKGLMLKLFWVFTNSVHCL